MKEKQFKINEYFTEKELEVINIHDSLVQLLYKPNMRVKDTELLLMGVELFSRTLARLLEDGDKDLKCFDRVDKLQSKIYALEKLNNLREEKQ